MLMMKQIMLLLKEEIRLISLWFIMSFLSKKHNWKSLMLMYIMTLEYSFLLINYLEKVIYEGWLGIPTIFIFSLDNKLGMVQIMN